MHRKFGFCAALLALTALSGSANGAPAFAEISAALAAGNGAAVLALADTGLREPNLSGADRARLLMDRGFGDQLLGQADDALTDLTQAIEIHGMTDLEQSRAYMERGIVLDGLGRIDDAIGDYSAVLRLDPSSLTALGNRARAYWRENHFEEARQDFLVSLAANNPAPEYSYYGLGQVAESEGKSEEAKDFYTKAVAADPHYSQAADRLAALGAPAGKQAAISPPSGKVIAQVAPLAPAATTAALPSPATKSVTAQDAPAAPLLPTIKTAETSPPARDSSPESAPPALRSPIVKTAKASPPPGATKTAGPPTPVLSTSDNAVPQVQLGAWRYQEEAETGWQRAVKKADGALAGLVPHIVIADVPAQGRFYRLRVETAKGKELCALLTAKGMACAPVRPPPSRLAKAVAPTPKLAANESHKR